MKYCMNCGKQLPDDAKFCVDCGTPVKEERTARRVEQAGTVYKCPNCGEMLESMTAVCPACGYEIRNAKATSSVQSFADQLAKIEAEEMPVVENNSFMKKVFGRDLRETPARLEEARRTFEKQKRDKKISLISNYPVPNTKEDLILESKYYVAVNGQPTGPYTVATLREMVQNGQLARLSLVWKDGMTGWSAVENVDALKPILAAVIPPIPTV